MYEHIAPFIRYKENYISMLHSSRYARLNFPLHFKRNKASPRKNDKFMHE